MKYRFRLFRVKRPWDMEASNGLFLQAVKEMCRFHYNHCEEYRRILDYFQVLPEDIKEYEEIEKIPVLPTLVFKKHKLFSMSKKRMPIRATSSGTKGSFSEIGFDSGSLFCGFFMILKICRLRKLISPIPCHYILLGYKPHKSNHTAVTKSAYGSTLFAPALSRSYALTYKDGRYTADLERVIRAIQKCGASRFPTRLTGFPSYTYFVLRMMDERGMHVKLAKGSKLILGGGWKEFYTEQVDKKTLYSLVEKVLGISDKEIIEFFSAVEHPIPYCDCENHHFHVPAYSRVIIRDVDTLKPLGCGQMGLVSLITPMVKATPILSVMTDDLGILHEGRECGCGLTSPYLEIIGRIGLRDIKTCAAGAGDLLREGKL